LSFKIVAIREIAQSVLSISSLSIFLQNQKVNRLENHQRFDLLIMRKAQTFYKEILCTFPEYFH